MRAPVRVTLGLVLAAACIGGCGESTKSPPVVQEMVKPTPEQEFAALLKRAEAGDAGAQFKLGLMYAKGESVPKDTLKAAELWQKAAAQGNAGAQISLGAIYAKGEGVRKDAVKAIDWYQKAAAQGDADAQFALGMMHLRGEGVPKHPVKAVEWFKKAATQGDTDAPFYLGSAYYSGIGVPRDEVKAVEWFQKSSAQGDAKSQLMLVSFYFAGLVVSKDYVLGYAWANLAAISDCKSCTDLRNNIELKLSPSEKAEGQRISSNWKKGQILVREGMSTTGTPPPYGTLSKQGTGTAFLVSNSGHALTNHHVINGCREVKAEGRDGGIKVVTSDTINDLALLQIPGAINATATVTSDPAKLRQGEDIVVFGFPLNSVLSSGGNLTPGVVSALTGLGNNTNQIQITAPIQPGSSGSPVLNKRGEVVGVVSMKLSDLKMAKATGQVGQTVNFAVGSQTLRSFLDTHNVEYRTGGGFFSWAKSNADLADEARSWTLLVECWK